MEDDEGDEEELADEDSDEEELELGNWRPLSDDFSMTAEWKAVRESAAAEALMGMERCIEDGCWPPDARPP